MNPWIAGRIIETMQQEAQRNGAEARLGRQATARRTRAPSVEAAREPRRARIGLAVARLGLRIAGRHDAAVAARTARPTFPTADRNPSYRSDSWTTCGATSTSSH